MPVQSAMDAARLSAAKSSPMMETVNMVWPQQQVGRGDVTVKTSVGFEVFVLYSVSAAPRRVSPGRLGSEALRVAEEWSRPGNQGGFKNYAQKRILCSFFFPNAFHLVMADLFIFYS